MTELTVNQVDVAKLKVEPGEILMVTVKIPLDQQLYARVAQAFKRAFEQSGGYVPGIIVVDDNIEASVIRAVDADETVTEQPPATPAAAT